MGLPLKPPIKPMLASPVPAVPQREDMLFEPKWDGFRCLLFVDPSATSTADADDAVVLQSRTGKPFNRYFPEVLQAVRAAVDRPMVLDGELVVVSRDQHGDHLDWDALSERIHPAASRVRVPANRTPARFIAF